MSNFNNSFGYASAATARPQPPPRRRANSMIPTSNRTTLALNTRRGRMSLAERPLVSANIMYTLDRAVYVCMMRVCFYFENK